MCEHYLQHRWCKYGLAFWRGHFYRIFSASRPSDAFSHYLTKLLGWGKKKKMKTIKEVNDAWLHKSHKYPFMFSTGSRECSFFFFFNSLCYSTRLLLEGQTYSRFYTYLTSACAYTHAHTHTHLSHTCRCWWIVIVSSVCFQKKKKKKLSICCALTPARYCFPLSIFNMTSANAQV